MKYYVIIFLLLVNFYSNGQSKDRFTFNLHYIPETKYRQSIIQNISTVVKYSGTDEVIQKLKENGIQSPTVTSKQTKIESLIKTGKLSNGINFPLTMEIIKITDSNGNKIFPDGTLIYGKGSINKMPTLDSIASEEMDTKLKMMILQVMQSTFEQLSFPVREVNVGETFSTDSPISIPVGPNKIDMKITTIYKLLSIKDGIADFDISQIYSMNTKIKENNLSATGSGKGKMFYDIANNFYSKYNLENEMSAHSIINNLELDITLKSDGVQTVVISKN